ncbi:MAG: fused MFS/spermidine synthase [Myxococcota bacterium]|nr:fused MFS/spermidine synthase [Myxococcota bacterium]
MQRSVSFLVVLLCFFLSGAAGLVYQTAWTREFAFVFGTSSLAVATVLAAYMAGLAAGAGLAARFTGRIQRPVLVYGLLELGIGVAALGLPLAVAGSRWVYVALFGGQPDLPAAGGSAQTLFQLTASFLILMVPTAMMGATLPLLVRDAVRREDEIGSRIGILYGMNTAGAVVGTLVAGFVLLPNLGLRPTVWVGVGLNGAVFLGAWWLSRSRPPLPVEVPGAVVAPAGYRWILPLIGVSGCVSFAYEVLWVRLLEHVLGGSVYAFATMLASFLSGIALGSALASRFATSRGRAIRGFSVAQLFAALLSVAGFVVIDELPRLAFWLHSSGVERSFAHALLSMLVLLPSTICIGATFPFAVRILAAGEGDAGPASARVFAANTVGSVIGALGAGFFVLPALGFVGMLSVCVGINLALSAASGLLARPRMALVAAAAGVGMAILLFVRPPTPWNVLRHSPLLSRIEPGKTIYFGVGRATTVLMVEHMGRWYLRTSGLPEAAIRPPLFHSSSALAHWLGALPVLARPDARSILVVGLGGGVGLESVPSGVERIDVIELEEEVVAANRAVAQRRWRDPLSDPRVHVHANDARNALLLTDRKFDAIVSQPSHPWSGGAAHLYTQEFFALVRDHLGEDGVFVQWIGLGFIDEALFRSLLASLDDVFEHVQVYSPGSQAGALFLASDAPLDIAASAAEALAEVRHELTPFGLQVAEDVGAALLLDEAGVRALGREAPINRDGNNRLQTGSPRVLTRSLLGRLPQLVGQEDALLGSLPRSFDRWYLLRHLPPWRAAHIVESFTDPTDRRIAEALIRFSEGKREAARKLLSQALAEAPRHREGRAVSLLLAQRAISSGQDPLTIVAAPLDGSEEPVVAGWQLLGSDVEAIEELEPALAAIPVRDPLAVASYRLRAEWRMHGDDLAIAREAIEMADLALHASGGSSLDLLLRARACALAGEPAAALHSLSRLSSALDGSSPRGRALAKLGLRVARSLPQSDELAESRALVERGLGARGR